MHALIVGGRKSGKSTLIARVLRALNLPAYGFESKKEDHLADSENGSPIYIYKAGQAHTQAPENLVGYCKNKRFAPRIEGFNAFAPHLQQIPDGHMIVLDEIGFMETEAEDFCAAILHLLDGDRPIIAAVKHKDMPYPQQVRQHANCRCFYITEENRDALFEEVLHFISQQLATCNEKEQHA